METQKYVSDVIKAWEEKIPLMQYQTKALISDAILKAQGELWERSAPDWYGKGIWDLEDPENSYTLEQLTKLDKQFANEEYEIVCTSSHSWFDDGGRAVDILLANQKSRDRVWGSIDTYIDHQGFILPLVFWEDFKKFPKDYILLSGGPR